uniref:RAB42, member RAS onco family n=1 Tax=Taeniopygia guttata TaxID=59729 RepID=A0A674H2N2_TAEGU
METVTDFPQDPDSEGHFQFRSSLLHCFTDGPGGGPGGAATSSPTVGVEFYSRTILMPPIGKAKLQLWDTAGRERFRSITRSFYQMVSRGWGEPVPAFVLVGHKCDLVAERAMSAEEAGHLTTTLGMAFVETLALSNLNVELAFQTLAGGIQQALGRGILAPHQGCDGIRLCPNQSHHQPLAGRDPGSAASADGDRGTWDPKLWGCFSLQPAPAALR